MIKSRKKASQAPQASLEACNAFARKTDQSLHEHARKEQARKDVAAARALLKGAGG